ncbi:MAG: hypothetical protein H6765_00025 [Candidatus Peribacteria bacterium]|nr:MAG: hypothetical protein H6765_00025 [Candidatus Peribacteria bacterium]
MIDTTNKATYAVGLGTPEQIMNEFDWFANVLGQAGYQRYELSNFAHAGHSSIHNMVYRSGQSYLGCGINAASYLNQQVWESAETQLLPSILQDAWQADTSGIRFQNTHHRTEYFAHTGIDEKSIEAISPEEQLYE